MDNALFNLLAVVVDPFDEYITCSDVVSLNPARRFQVLDVERGAPDFEGKGGFEGFLGLAIEVDAEFLEVGRVCELRIDARRSIFEQRELGEVSLGAVKELMRPCALEGLDLGRGEEGLKTVVEIFEVL